MVDEYKTRGSVLIREVSLFQWWMNSVGHGGSANGGKQVAGADGGRLMVPHSTKLAVSLKTLYTNQALMGGIMWWVLVTGAT